MSPVNSIFDFGKFYLVSALAEDATTIDIVAASDKYTMENQKSPGTLFTSGRITAIDKTNNDNFINIAFSGCVQNGFINGKPRYTLTIRKASDGTTIMMGLANTDDGTNDTTNVIANNKVDVFPLPSDSLCLVVVGSAEYNEMLTLFSNALAEITEQSDMLAQKVFMSMKAMEQRLKDDQDAYETSITAQQTAFETQMQSDYDNFVASQRQITAIVNAVDGKLIDISAGKWIDGQTLRSYAGVSSHNPTDNKTLYYELVAGTGVLASNETGFIYGNFPIAKIVTDASGNVTSVENYGSAFSVKDNDKVSEIDNTDSPYTATNSEKVINGDCSSGAITLNLPTATRAGQVFVINHVGTSNSITVDPNGSETIDGATTEVLDTQYQSLVLVSDGTNWKIKSKYTPSSGGAGATLKVDAHASANVTLTGAMNIVMNTEDTDVDGEYNNTTGVFTADADGMYFFEFIINVEQSRYGARLNLEIKKNSTVIMGASCGSRDPYLAKRSYLLSTMISLSAGDTVTPTVATPVNATTLQGHASDQTLMSRIRVTKI